MIDEQRLKQYQQDGYIVVRGLFSAQEAAHYRAHFMTLREAGSYPGDFIGVEQPNDPLQQYPRMFNMHHWDQLSRAWLLDDRLRQCLTTLLGREPYATQTMLYFKPPQSRGQALHQDQYYLRVSPGTCMAAWMALDRADEANGCMRVVPGTQALPLICPVEADTSQSFTDIVVPLPAGVEPVPVVMEPGDVLFFNGQLIHGSYPNTTTDRFRRSLVGHYIEGVATEVAWIDHPVFRMDGTVVEAFGLSEDGGECGVWVDQVGKDLVEMSGNYRLSEPPPDFSRRFKEADFDLADVAKKVER